DRLQRDLTIFGQGALVEGGTGWAAAHPPPEGQAIARAVQKQGGTAGAEVAAGTAQGPRPPADVPVSGEPQNKATVGETGQREQGGESLTSVERYRKLEPVSPTVALFCGSPET